MNTDLIIKYHEKLDEEFPGISMKKMEVNKIVWNLGSELVAILTVKDGKPHFTQFKKKFKWKIEKKR